MNKYKLNEIIKGTVTGIENYGIFIKIDEEYSGLVHISEISESFVKNVNDYAKIGDIIEVKIIDIDEENHHAKLSIKQINPRNNKKIKTKIIETESGFSHLKANLNTWINKKIAEIEENTENY